MHKFLRPKPEQYSEKLNTFKKGVKKNAEWPLKHCFPGIKTTE